MEFCGFIILFKLTVLTTLLLIVGEVHLISAKTMVYKKYYPNTKIERWSLSKKEIPWSYHHPKYLPKKYNAPCPPGKVCDTENYDVCYRYNSIDGSVNRQSILGKYGVDKFCFPQNPKGRSGLRGRGELFRWGPNHYVQYVISRGVNVREYLVVNSDDKKNVIFPGEFVDNSRNITFPPMLLNFIESNLSEKYPENVVQEIIENALKNRILRYHGYYADDRNTDNAWMETLIYDINDSGDSNLGLLDTEHLTNSLNLTWKTIDKSVIDSKIQVIVKRARLTFGQKVASIIRSALKALRDENKAGIMFAFGDAVNNFVGLSAIVITLVDMEQQKKISHRKTTWQMTDKEGSCGI
ncbi:putative nudix hydrolase 6 [Trichinella spiralis]|uniref:Putative nudix hydrolase 6 n=1 Tax=Trichinella spiralis TaxID=6334 RepID=A0A0V1BUX6_TRISP|nr:putative nudix hydrolase 6 [Trichinella spiralis]